MLRESIVVPGKTAEDAPWALHQYRLEGRRLQKLRHVKWPCENEPVNKAMLGVMVEGKEFLAVACDDCRDIKLMNLETGETHVAYRSEKKPYKLCHGEAGRMWICSYNDKAVRELNCSSETFTETGRTVNTSGAWRIMCYLPDPYRALVFACFFIGLVQAVSCETGQQLWKLQGEVDGKKITPWRVVFHPQLSLLISVDRDQKRLLLSDPGSGEPMQSIGVPEDGLWDVVGLRGQLILLYGSRIILAELKQDDHAEGRYRIECPSRKLFHCAR